MAAVALHGARFTTILLFNLPVTNPRIWAILAIIVIVCIGAIAYAFIPEPKHEFFRMDTRMQTILGGLAIGILFGASVSV